MWEGFTRPRHWGRALRIEPVALAHLKGAHRETKDRWCALCDWYGP